MKKHRAPEIIIRRPFTTAIVEVRCECYDPGKLLYVGQITGVVQLVCDRRECKKLVQVEPSSSAEDEGDAPAVGAYK